MMKINELMIGDWVNIRFENIYEKVDSNVRVSELREDSIWGEGEGNLGRGDIVYPIPLTAEILKKNGFERFIDADLVCYRKGHLKVEVGVGYQPFEDHRFYVTPIPKRFYYVHELQQALRLLGLSDIADNFRV